MTSDVKKHYCHVKFELNALENITQKAFSSFVPKSGALYLFFSMMYVDSYTLLSITCTNKFFFLWQSILRGSSIVLASKRTKLCRKSF